MNTTIIYDGSFQGSLSDTVNQLICKEFSNLKSISLHKLQKETLKPCIGCFNCWIKTPGQCIIKDDIIGVSKDYVRSDLAVFVTPLVYGSYSSTIKRTIDRMCCPTLLPFFRKFKSEVHHQLRYPKRPNLMILAYSDMLTPQEKETFVSLIKANSLNLGIPIPKVFFCTNEIEIKIAAANIKAEIINNEKEKTHYA